MAILVPESTRKFEQDWLIVRLEEVLYALVEFTSAKSGWVGLSQQGGRLVFPIVLGDFTEHWLTRQQGTESTWGFTFREDSPTLVNDLREVPGFGQPSLQSILSCPII